MALDLDLVLIGAAADELAINLAGVQRPLRIAEAMQRIQPMLDEHTLTTGHGRRLLLTEMRRLRDVIGF